MTTRETTRQSRQGKSLQSGKFLLASLAVLHLLILSLFTGEYDIFGQADGASMFSITRIPRTLALILAGAAMAMSGLVMQMLTQNKFVEPTTTGTTEWASLGLLFMLYFYPAANILQQMSAAVLFAFIGSMVFFLFLRRVSLRSSLIVPIVGMMLGAVVSAFTTFFALQTNLLQNLGVWFAGSFTSVIKGQYEVLWLVLLVLALIFWYADRLTVAGLGQDFATNVGLNYSQIVLIGTSLIAIATGVVTVVVGSLPFLGLIVPNLVSIFRGDDLRSNLPWVALTGIGVVTACDLIGRTIIAPFEIPVSVILGIVGAIVFIGLIVKGRNRVPAAR